MLKATSGLAALLLLGTAGCVDLAVPNSNAPDAARALATAGDVLSLIAGGYNRWSYVQEFGGPEMWLSVASGQHSAPWANSGMEYYGRIPRQPTINQAGGANVATITEPFYQSYRVLAAMHDGLQQIDSGKVKFGGDTTLMAQAYAKYMQGLALGTVALLYDSAYVYDETMGPKDAKLADYQTAMTAALGYFDKAITLATGAGFTIPATWMSQDVPAATLVQLAHSYKARFRAAVARTPDERKAVDWTAVAADAAAGVTADWDITMDCSLPSFCANRSGSIEGMMFDGWQMQSNWIAGMADQSGGYQAWIDTAVTQANAQNVNPFLIVTPDTRWPQGATEAAQLASPGEYYSVNSGDNRIWSKPDRGKWRWSYYEQTYEPYYTGINVYDAGSFPEVKVEELKALIAEGAYYAGDWTTVADFINATRTTHGLNATVATQAGTNTSCVPKMPQTYSGGAVCGDLWEMLKWEKRLETQFAGPLRVGWYFDGRGWGDLMQGTILQLPVPYREMESVLGEKPYNYGGVGGKWGAPVGTYGY